MGFRDDHDAALARASALERENARLRAEVHRLERGEPVPPEPGPDAGERRRTARAGLLALIGGLVTLGGCAVAVALALGAVEVAVGIGALTIALLIPIPIAAGLMVVPGADDLLVLSGRRYAGPAGSTRGFRVLRPGDPPVLRIPFLEQVGRLHAGPIPVTLAVRSFYCKGNQTLDARGTGTVRIIRHEPQVHHAVERFLGRFRAEIGRVAAETLAGHLRAVAADLTAAELTSDPARVADQLRQAASEDLAKLGLELLTLDLQL
jgi:uncharacterized membrane protein YqiK